MSEIPLSMAIGGTVITVPDLRRTPDVQVALGMFLRALAEEVDPEEVFHASNQGQAESSRD
jgi:hypothetical protein